MQVTIYSNITDARIPTQGFEHMQVQRPLLVAAEFVYVVLKCQQITKKHHPFLANQRLI